MADTGMWIGGSGILKSGSEFSQHSLPSPSIPTLALVSPCSLSSDFQDTLLIQYKTGNTSVALTDVNSGK